MLKYSDVNIIMLALGINILLDMIRKLIINIKL